MKKSAKGFTIVTGLLVLVLAGVIVGAGWWVAKSQSDTNKPVENAPVSQKINTNPTEEAKSTTKYLTITEWKVRVPMASDVDVNDIYHVIKTDAQNGNSPEAFLGSKKLDQIVTNCNINKKGITPFGSIERMTVEAFTKAHKDFANTGITNGQKLGSYYYVWQVPLSNCYAAEAAKNASVKAKIGTWTQGDEQIDNLPDAMVEALTKIEAIN